MLKDEKKFMKHLAEVSGDRTRALYSFPGEGYIWDLDKRDWVYEKKAPKSLEEWMQENGCLPSLEDSIRYVQKLREGANKSKEGTL